MFLLLSEIYNYQRIQLSNNKFINGILEGGGGGGGVKGRLTVRYIKLWMVPRGSLTWVSKLRAVFVGNR